MQNEQGAATQKHGCSKNIPVPAGCGVCSRSVLCLYVGMSRWPRVPTPSALLRPNRAPVKNNPGPWLRCETCHSLLQIGYVCKTLACGRAFVFTKRQEGPVSKPELAGRVELYNIAGCIYTFLTVFLSNSPMDISSSPDLVQQAVQRFP